MTARCLAVCLALLSVAAPAETIVGRVVGVTDGDTVVVLDAGNRQHKIRLGAIDAPEKAQPFGQRAKQNLSLLVFGRDVEIDWQKRDRYERIVGKVRVADPACQKTVCPKVLDAGEAQIRSGMAWWFERYAAEQAPEDARRYAFAEQQARIQRVGLWSDPAPIAPWEYRKARR